jgi:rhodanese-related sulfurtransferase
MRELIRQAAVLLALAALPAVVQAVRYSDRVSWRAPAVAKDEVTLEQARAWGDTVFWIDARPDEQYAQRHVPDAVSLNEDRWSELLPQVLQAWSPDKRTVVYCSSQSCAASHEVARRLRDEGGLQNVFVLHGGWETWLEAQK